MVIFSPDNGRRSLSYNHVVTSQIVFTRPDADFYDMSVRRSADTVRDSHCQVIDKSRSTATESRMVSPRLKKPSLDTADMANFQPVSNLSFCVESR